MPIKEKSASRGKIWNIQHNADSIAKNIWLLMNVYGYVFIYMRYIDCLNDDNDKQIRLLSEYLIAVKRELKKRDDFDSKVLWLIPRDWCTTWSNTVATSRSKLRLRGDLGEYRVVLTMSNVADWIFNVALWTICCCTKKNKYQINT